MTEDQQSGAPSCPALPLEEIIAAALETKPLTPEEKKALEEEYRKRERGKRGRKKGQD